MAITTCALDGAWDRFLIAPMIGSLSSGQNRAVKEYRFIGAFTTGPRPRSAARQLPPGPIRANLAAQLGDQGVQAVISAKRTQAAQVPSAVRQGLNGVRQMVETVNGQWEAEQ